MLTTVIRIIRPTAVLCLPLVLILVGASPSTGDPGSPCHLSGGGCLKPSGPPGSHLQATFGGSLGRPVADPGPLAPGWEHFYRDGRTLLVRFQSLDAHATQCRPEPKASCPPPVGASRVEFEGTGTVTLGDGVEAAANFHAWALDVGSCGAEVRDSYSIVIRRGLVIGQGDILHQIAGDLDCGNFNVEAPWNRK